MTQDRGKWLDEAGPRTRAIRAGIRRTSEQEHVVIFTSSSFVFDSAEDAAAKFSGDAAGNVYSRYTNPTVRLEGIFALEQGEAAVATASGMSLSSRYVWRTLKPAIMFCAPVMYLVIDRF